MRILFVIIALVWSTTAALAQVTVCSWNVQNFGKSKKDTTLQFMAKQVLQCDILAIQEINTGPDGAQTLAKLVDILNRISGKKWISSISAPTTSDNPHEKERYAYIWQDAKVKAQGKGYLDNSTSATIVREPYIMNFKASGNVFTLVNFHAVPQKKNPAQELAQFKDYPSRFTTYPFVILGDFNTKANHNVFNPLKNLGYQLAFQGEKTTLRQQCVHNDCKANDYDNMIYDARKMTIVSKQVIDFYTLMGYDMKAARKVSDHIPIQVQFKFKFK